MEVSQQWEEFPSYTEFFRALRQYIVKQLQDARPTPGWRTIYNINYIDVAYVVFFTMLWSILRHVSTEKIFKPMGYRYALTAVNQAKMPESAFKFLYFLTGWIANCYILIFSGDYKFLQKPSSVWDDWSLNEPIPTKIYLFYLAQFGWYLHSLYATVFIDEWRKDSVQMIVHHITAITLTVISFASRCHNLGCLVIFFHDITDIFMEFAKLNVYFKIQNNQVVKLHEILANVSFFNFIATWCFSRLYCFPLRVIYALLLHVDILQSVVPSSLIVFCLSWVLVILNIYWFFLIMHALYKVAKGAAVDDTREYDVQEKLKKQD